MEPISNPAMRVITKLAGEANNEGLERSRCAWAWGLYEKTGEAKYLGAWEYFAERWQVASGRSCPYADNISKLKDMGIL